MASLPDVLPLLRVVLGSVGLTGMFYVVGYVLEYSRQSFLGIEIPMSATDYVLSAAGFLVDVWRTIVEWFYASLLTINWTRALLGLATALLIVGIVTAVTFVGRRRAPARGAGKPGGRRYWAWRASVAVFVVIVTVLTFMVDWPVVMVHSVLVEPATLKRQFVRAPLVSDRVDRIWTEIICSRVGREVEARCEADTDAYRLRLTSRFLASLFWAVVLTAVGGLLLNARRETRAMAAGAGRADSTANPPPTRLAVGDFVLALMVAVALFTKLVSLPYLYGRILASTEAVEVIIDFETGGTARGIIKAEAPEAITLLEPTENETIVVPRSQVRLLRYRTIAGDRHASIEYPKDGRIEPVQGHVLGTTASSVVLFEKRDQLVWEIPRGRIRLTKTKGRSDVLTRHILQSYANSARRAPGR